MMKRLMLIGIVCCVAVGFCRESEAADAEISRLQTECEAVRKESDDYATACKRYEENTLRNSSFNVGFMCSAMSMGLMSGAGAIIGLKEAAVLGCVGGIATFVYGISRICDGTKKRPTDTVTDSDIYNLSFGDGLCSGSCICFTGAMLLKVLYNYAFDAGTLSALAKC